MQCIVLVARSQTAGIPRRRGLPQLEQTPSYLTRHVFMCARYPEIPIRAKNLEPVEVPA
jgi:hypothetical protein